MIKVLLSALFVMSALAGIQCAENKQNWAFSPYANKMQLAKTRTLSKNAMPQIGGQLFGNQQQQQQAPQMQMQQPELRSFMPQQMQQPELRSFMPPQMQQPNARSAMPMQVQQQPDIRSLPQLQLQQQQQQQRPNIQQQLQAPIGLQQLLPNVRVPDVKPIDAFCAGRQENERIPHPQDTGKFIVCHLNGDFTTMDCPAGLVFNLNTLNCENSIKLPKGCSSNPCQNGAKCTDLPFFQYKCDCAPGFSGDLCDRSNSCGQSSCGNNGFCMQLAIGSPVDHFCICQNGLSYGLDCGPTVEPNPCMPNDADNDFFASKTNPAIFVQCEGHIPHLKFCNYPLIFSEAKQQCDWRDV